MKKQLKHVYVVTINANQKNVYSNDGKLLGSLVKPKIIYIKPDGI